LQARLHRQQRYTLQFKAALEKSLEVSSPPFESVAAAVAAVSTTENFFLPKAQRIQPWAVPEEESTHLPWMKLSSGGLEEVNPVSDGDAGDEAGEMSDGRESLEALPAFRAEAAPPRPQPVKPRAAVVQLPGFGNPIPRSTAQPTAITGATYAASQSAVNPTVPAEIPDEHLKQKLDAVVQPLADMLAQAMFSETQELSAEAAQLTHAQSNRSHAAMSEPIDAVADTQDEFASESAQVTQSSDEALLNSVMAEAEDALWQDLARLIDVSTEDIVKASLSGDVSAFESIDFEAAQAEIPPRSVETPEAPLEDLIQSSPERPDTPPVQAPSPRVSRSASAFAPKQSSRSQSPQSSEPPGQSDVAASHVAASQQAPQPQAAPAPSIGSNPSWPSPVVYPLRPAKKRRSLAAVDLPSFLQQEPGPLPT
jgi:hypothetical protein